MNTTRSCRLLLTFLLTLGLLSCSFSGSKTVQEQVDETNGLFADLVTNQASQEPFLPSKASEAKSAYDTAARNRLKNSTAEAKLKQAIADAGSEVLKTQLQFRLALYHTLRGTGGNIIRNAWAPVVSNTKNLPSRERIITDSRAALIFWYGDGIGAHRYPPKGRYKLDQTGTSEYVRDILGIWSSTSPTPDTLPASFKTAGYSNSPVGQAEKGLLAALKANNKELAFYFAVLMDDMILRTYRTRAFKNSETYWTNLLIHANQLSRRAFSADDIANCRAPLSGNTPSAAAYRRHHIARIGTWLTKARRKLNISQPLGW